MPSLQASYHHMLSSHKRGGVLLYGSVQMGWELGYTFDHFHQRHMGLAERQYTHTSIRLPGAAL